MIIASIYDNRFSLLLDIMATPQMVSQLLRSALPAIQKPILVSQVGAWAVAVVAILTSSSIYAQYTGTVLYHLDAPPGYTAVFANHAAGGTVAGQGSPSSSGGTGALWWNSAPGTVLHPASGYGFTVASGTDGVSQVGYGRVTTSEFSSDAALLWSGTAGSVVQIGPVGAGVASFATAVQGSQQVGHVINGGTTSAYLWAGTPGSAVSLHPAAGYTSTYALGTSVTNQVGYGWVGLEQHALLWSGTAASVVDLNPAGVTVSHASGVGGSQQVGYGNGLVATGSSDHAFLWTGSAASAVDLHPASLISSYGLDTNGVNQVGYGSGASFSEHALAWSGTSASVIDLHSLLPPTVSGTSRAYAIDDDGVIYGTVNGFVGAELGLFAVKWTPVPEPSAIGLAIAAGAFGILLRRRFSMA
jgi:hypothetical protein